jgi:hypothetical protein
MQQQLSPAEDVAGPTSSPPRLPELARGPVFSAMATVAVVLTAFSGGYGYHRDELYFLMLPPRWGYVDQPPLTPLLAGWSADAFGDRLWALRLPATVAVVLSVLVLALVTRELGGGRGAQTLCAWGYAFASMTLVFGHVLLTSSVDLPVWPAVLLFAVRAVLRDRPQWWLLAGVVVGVSMYNKLLVALLVVALAAGVALVGPRRLLWSRWAVGAVGLGLVIGAPNLVYQATNGWPQLAMGGALADNNADETRILMWPMLLVMLGPPLVPVWVAGLVGLLRRHEWRPVRFVAVAFPVLLVLVFVMGTQFYYPFGVLAVLYAVGCVPVAAWVGRSRPRRRVVASAVALNAAVSTVLALPVVPLPSLGDTPVADINQVPRDSVGWPTYVRQVAHVYRSLDAEDRSSAVVVASNYGEAGAVERYGAGLRLPRVYSGQNQLYYERRPPDTASVVVFVGGQLVVAQPLFRSCDVRGRLDNHLDVDNEEQGQPIAVCRGPVGGWDTVWPRLRHLD